MKMEIDHLSYDELVELNHRVVERLRFLDHARAHAAMLEFHIGQRVSFEATDRGTLYGVITKYNKKTVSVVTDQGQPWRVPPSHLKSAQQPGARMESGVRLLGHE